MNGAYPLEHQTVLVRDGLIAAVGPARSVEVPKRSTIINGRGRYLIPGLADMHAHFLRPPNASGRQDLAFDHYREINQRFAFLFIANGVTSIRNMYGHPAIDALSNRIEKGELPGPTIYSTGPITDGEPPSIAGVRVVTNTDQAEQAVHDDKVRGYVGIKVYSRLTLDAYKAIAASAEAEHLPVMGHLPFAVPLDEAIQRRQASIEHADSFLGDLQPNPADADNETDVQLFANADLTKMGSFGAKMRDAGVWTCPTVAAYQMEWSKEQVAEGMRFVPAELVAAYRRHYQGFTFADAGVEIAYGIKIVHELHRAGAGLLAGSDAFKPNVVPGFALIDELKYFVSAGLTPYEALKAATSDAAGFLGRAQDFGTVAVGRRADLVLLKSNPVDDIGNLTKRVGVMARGRWFTERQLRAQLNRFSDVR
jgi:cytosine/adenosine deaminase-related metal-dependent hydrolase